jgi:hypothetical protein
MLFVATAETRSELTAGRGQLEADSRSDAKNCFPGCIFEEVLEGNSQ